MIYQIQFTNRFKKDYKLIVKRNYDIRKFENVIALIATGQKLPPKYKEHKLTGNFNDCWECHIEPDWLLIYIRDEKFLTITFVRTGTHSDLF